MYVYTDCCWAFSRRLSFSHTFRQRINSSFADFVLVMMLLRGHICMHPTRIRAQSRDHIFCVRERNMRLGKCTAIFKKKKNICICLQAFLLANKVTSSFFCLPLFIRIEMNWFRGRRRFYKIKENAVTFTKSYSTDT